MAGAEQIAALYPSNALPLGVTVNTTVAWGNGLAPLAPGQVDARGYVDLRWTPQCDDRSPARVRLACAAAPPRCAQFCFGVGGLHCPRALAWRIGGGSSCARMRGVQMGLLVLSPRAFGGLRFLVTALRWRAAAHILGGGVLRTNATRMLHKARSVGRLPSPCALSVFSSQRSACRLSGCDSASGCERWFPH